MGHAQARGHPDAALHGAAWSNAHLSRGERVRDDARGEAMPFETGGSGDATREERAWAERAMRRDALAEKELVFEHGGGLSPREQACGPTTSHYHYLVVTTPRLWWFKSSLPLLLAAAAPRLWPLLFLD